MAEPLLRAEHLGISFRGLRALDDVNFSIPQGAVMGLIGPNGAGKTTLFNLLTGVYTPTDGTVTLDGEVISGKGMRYTVRHGISRTFQNIRLFKDMTVLDNVKAAMHDGMHYNLLESVLKTRRFWNCSLSLIWIRRRTCGRAICPTDSSASWRLPGHWRPIPSSSAWTNRQRA